MIKKEKNGLIDRAIENWLASTNEIGYQVPFCHCLISEGSTVLHLSTPGKREQAKDIISIDKHGQPCAYKIKAGNIDLIEWRRIKGEIDELVETPINCTGINKDKKHRSVLVTNGKISDQVKDEINNLNPVYKKRGFSELEVITGIDLLKRFLKVQTIFFPRELSDFKLLFLSVLKIIVFQIINWLI